MITHVKLSRQEDIDAVCEWSQMVGKTKTKSIILAVKLAKKYQQLELENRALKIALAQTQKETPDGFFSYVSNVIGEE